ncbi:hypothetical protein ES705_28585 [subsurface metagenome]
MKPGVNSMMGLMIIVSRLIDENPSTGIINSSPLYSWYSASSSIRQLLPSYTVNAVDLSRLVFAAPCTVKTGTSGCMPHWHATMLLQGPDGSNPGTSPSCPSPDIVEPSPSSPFPEPSPSRPKPLLVPEGSSGASVTVCSLVKPGKRDNSPRTDCNPTRAIIEARTTARIGRKCFFILALY